ncbi:hypothetical protein C9439_04385 [archaeon SCG-AAA382B04]|nr:hypothetical protein C9439_04385 [archaeon SCG-AAA382B04]
MGLNKRVPVSQERWKELSNLKEPGQTYDELLKELVEMKKKKKLFKDIEEIKKNQEYHELEEV